MKYLYLTIILTACGGATATEATPSVDASLPPQRVACGSVTCNVEDDDFCCVHPDGSSACEVRSLDCKPENGFTRIECDDKSDCPHPYGNEPGLCCRGSGISRCRTGSCPAGEVELP